MLRRLVFGLLLIPMVILAQDAASPVLEAKPLRVGISPFDPFIFLDNPDEPTGFSIELWESVARELGVKFEYVTSKGVAQKLQQLRDGTVDLAIGGITVTRERELDFDFTHPTFETGLDVLVRSEGSLSIISALKTFFSPAKSGIVLGFIVLIILAGHLMWIAERGKDAFNDHYFPGVFEGMYWAIVTASTVGYGDKAPVKWSGRVLAGFVIIVSLPLFCLFTAQLASTLSVQALRQDIRGPGDLPGRPVAVLKGTTSAEFMEHLDSKLITYERIADAYAALENHTVDAVVYDSPNLQYYAKTKGQGKVTVSGKPFMKQNFALCVPQGSPLREKINLQLLELRKTGEFDRILTRWFGESTE